VLFERMSSPWRACGLKPKMSPIMRMAFLDSEGPVISVMGLEFGFGKGVGGGGGVTGFETRDFGVLAFGLVVF